VKLQADNHVRWDVAARLNRKQMKHLGEKMKKWHTSTSRKNGLNPKNPSLKNSCAKDWCSGESNHQPYA
jgi:transposase